MTIELYDNYNKSHSTTVIAHERRGARPWITERQAKAAGKRIGLLSGSFLRASGALIDAGYDGVDVCNKDGELTWEIRA